MICDYCYKKIIGKPISNKFNHFCSNECKKDYQIDEKHLLSQK